MEIRIGPLITAQLFLPSASYLGDFHGARTQQLQGRRSVDDDLTIGGDHRVQQGIHAGIAGPWMKINHHFCTHILKRKGMENGWNWTKKGEEFHHTRVKLHRFNCFPTKLRRYASSILSTRKMKTWIFGCSEMKLSTFSCISNMLHSGNLR